MIKINFHKSDILLDVFLKTGNECILEKREEEIELLFNTHKQNIFKKIKLITGMEWKLSQVDIWIINGTFPTSPHPNLLNITNSNQYILFDLIYLIIHNLFVQNNFYSRFYHKGNFDSDKVEAIIYLITIEILKEIISGSELIEIIKKSKMGGFNQYLWDIIEKLKDSLEDLNKIPLVKQKL